MEPNQTPTPAKKVINLDNISLTLPIKITEQASGHFKSSMPYLFGKDGDVKVFGIGTTLEESIDDFYDKYQQHQTLTQHLFNEEHGNDERIFQKEIEFGVRFDVYVSMLTFERIKASEELKSYFLQFQESHPDTKFYIQEQEKYSTDV